ncbi:MAG: transcriptional regulator TrmB, partial [Candidatus Kerfeldbacteria bacterium]|nr:transcriptional regulator TrmB [Candidatus Kerfeldbacteria bacterium]
IIGTEKETFGMIIESEDFYQTQKNLFEVLWDVSRIGKRVDE